MLKLMYSVLAECVKASVIIPKNKFKMWLMEYRIHKLENRIHKLERR